VPAVGVPLSTPLELRVAKLGAPEALKVIAAGKPVAVTENEPNAPVVKVVPGALVKLGGWSTVMEAEVPVMELFEVSVAVIV
jgi:urocanate hydratase